jgi:hypothetical protein
LSLLISHWACIIIQSANKVNRRKNIFKLEARRQETASLGYATSYENEEFEVSFYPEAETDSRKRFPL